MWQALEFLGEAVPGPRRLAVLANVEDPAAVLEKGEAEATAGMLGFEVITPEIRRAEDIAPAFDASKTERTHFMFVPTR